MTDVPAMTVTDALGVLPSFVAENLGERALEKCLNRAGLTSIIDNQTCGYIPEISLDRFLDQAAREAGDAYFGATVAPLISVRDYGVWGDYILGAPTLGEAMERAVATIGLRSSTVKRVSV